MLFGGGFSIAWFFERKKNKALANQEVAKASQEEATALTNMQNAYKEFTEDMNQRYDTLRSEFDELKKKNCRSSKSVEGKRRRISPA